MRCGSALRGHDQRLRLIIALVALSTGLTTGCGAKTGLKVPDGGAEAGFDDAGLDGGIDAGPDAGSDASLPCFDIPLDAGVVNVSLEIEAELRRADIAFLVDTTASMQDEIDRVRNRLRDLVAPAIYDAIPDAHFAVATFEDFPVEPYGNSSRDVPFRLMLPRTEDLTRVQGALNAVELGDGQDEPESQVEALYQLATGAGHGSFIEPSAGCPSGGMGYPCFRDDALPVVLLFTDAPFHNGPGGRHPYGGSITPPPHEYPDAVEALRRIDARVIGFDSGAGAGGRDMRQIARDTSAIDHSGNPLVFDIGRRGERLDTEVVEAMQVFADTVIFDIGAEAVDPRPGDDVDVTEFVEEIVPLEAQPEDGLDSIDPEAGVFRGVRSGTRVTFQLRIRNDALVPGEEPQRFPLEIRFIGDGRTLLDRRTVDIVIPGADGEGCDELP